jgi:DNA-binding transcriptional regulator YiaG
MGKRKKIKSTIFAEKVKKTRKTKGMTQEQFANELKVSQAAVVKWEAGNLANTANLTDLSKMAEQPISWFLEGKINWGGTALPTQVTELTLLSPLPEKSPEKGVDIVPAKRDNEPVIPMLPELIERLNRATKPRGKKTELAGFLGVPLKRVSEWLSSDIEPGGKTTLKMLQWVEQQERQK